MGLMYGGLAKELNLTTDQYEKLTELILDQQMQAMDKAQSFFNQNTTTEATNLAAVIGEEQKQSDDSIKALLGDDKFAQYNEYKKTMTERMQINLFKQQLDGGQFPLQEEQMKQLIALIGQEKERNPPVISQDATRSGEQLNKIFSGDLIDKQVQWQEEMNRRVLERAGQILTPEQLKAYGDFQNQQLSMQKLGMKMATEMFGNKNTAGDSKPQPPAK